MTYSEIYQVVRDKYDWQTPIIADDTEGHQIVINEGHENIYVNNNMIDSHYFIVYTYLDQTVRAIKYYDVDIAVEVPVSG